jgi:hypothetical protein
MFCTFAHSSLIIWYMLYYIKKYPVSLFIILTVIYLSFFKPPSTEISKIPNIDKVVHICMYFGMSGMLWLEFLRAHRRQRPFMACMGRGVCLSRFVQRNGGVAARILHDIPWWRLAGFCGQYHGSGACINGRLFHFKAKDEIGL